MALSAGRKISRLADKVLASRPMKGGVTIFQGGLVIQAAGFCRAARAGQGADNAAKAVDAATYRAVGVALHTVVNSGADGDARIDTQAGCFNFKNSAAGVDFIDNSDVGSVVYVVDDETVAKTSASGTRCAAGRVHEVDADGVWVIVGDEASAAGRRTLPLPFAINETDTLAGTSAELVAPVSGYISQLSVIVQKAVTTGGDVTAAVGATAVAGLACTIADAATKGTVVSDTPTAGDATTFVKKGDRIQIVPAAPFNTAGAVSGFLEITY
ncbi:hypothetical protein [Caulobacter soli]|uniref:hypothetical protein n=1 Tax=Caulobacter soli TaxID=2708539 RepID=UPI0013EE3619|nr:hypothetical protein [Caulobacter soli]